MSAWEKCKFQSCNPFLAVTSWKPIQGSVQSLCNFQFGPQIILTRVAECWTVYLRSGQFHRKMLCISSAHQWGKLSMMSQGPFQCYDSMCRLSSALKINHPQFVWCRMQSVYLFIQVVGNSINLSMKASSTKTTIAFMYTLNPLNRPRMHSQVTPERTCFVSYILAWNATSLILECS